jgi:type II secretory pathway component PulF
VLAALWPAALAFAVFIADRASFDAEFLRSGWISAIPALVGAAAVSYFVTSQWAQRVWTGWLLIMPIGGLIVLGYSLKQYFLR